MKKSLLFILILFGVLSLHAQNHKHYKDTIDVVMESSGILTQPNLVSVLICPGTHTFTLGAVSGGSGTSSYTWQRSYDNENWTNVQGPNTTLNYTTPTLGWGTVTYFRRVANRGGCSTVSNSATVTVVPLPPRPEFMAYNLGADSTIIDPIDQMAYLSTQIDQMDGHVFGGLYQWGRKPVAYAINPTTYLRYGGYAPSNHCVQLAAGATYDPTTGQILTNPGTGFDLTNNCDTVHICSNSIPYDWRGSGAADPSCSAGNQCNSLWGNGEAINTPTPGTGAVLYTDGNYYQKPVKTVNDPCPSGYRVPTQNDWELWGNYSCNPYHADVSFGTTNLITKPANNSGLTWVNVRCGGGDCTVSNSWNSTSTWGGYAIYETSVWEAAPVVAGGSLISASAPQPLLFLPAAGYHDHIYCLEANMGMRGYYWTSSITGITAYCITFESNYVQFNLSNHYRAHGLSVRCVKCAFGEDCYVPEP